MDQVSAKDTSGDTARDGVRARRKRMRAEARAQRPAGSEADRFQTPEWLERSFVLPLTEPELSDVPSQSMPHHDDFSELPLPSQAVRATCDGVAGPGTNGAVTPLFVRPPSREIDFARVIKRSDLTRKATRMALLSTGVTGLALIAYLLSASPAVLTLTLMCAAVALAAVGVRLRMATAPIPHLER